MNQIIFPQIQELTFTGLTIIGYVWNENGNDFMRIIATLYNDLEYHTHLIITQKLEIN